MGAKTTGSAAAVIVACIAGCPRVDPFACGQDVGRCDLREGGACVEGWCAYPDGECGGGLRWHADAPGVGGTCVPLDEGSSSDGGQESGTDTGSSEGSSTGTTPSCGVEVEVSVDTAALAGDEVLEGYPLFVALEDPALAGIDSAWWADARGGALPFELEAVDPAAGSWRGWVSLPAWVPGQPLELRLRFGHPDAVPPVDATAVWPAGFVGVWHLDDPLSANGADLQLDSTALQNHGVVLGGMTAEQVVPGVAGEALAFDGDDDEIQLVDASFIGALDSSTLSIWGRVDADGSVENPFFSRVNGDDLFPRCRIRPDSDGAVQCQTQVGEMTWPLRAPAELVPRGEWHHVAITYDANAGHFALYTNGMLVEEETTAMEPQVGGDSVPQLARINEFGFLLGALDEFRVVDHPLPAAWIVADERSQGDPGAITTIVGAPVPTPCP